MRPVIFLLNRLRRLHRAVLVAAGAVLLIAAPVRADVPAVVVSIKPIHSLVAAVMAGVGTPDLIVDGKVSLHEYRLKPTDTDRINKARLVFWVGPMLETFLKPPLVDATPPAEVVQLSEAPGIRLLETRQSGGWGAGPDARGMLPTGFATDGHLWLDPLNAQRIVASAATHLAAADPEHASRYTRNAAELYRRLDALDAALRPKLAALASRPFLVYHDAYQYFERRYGLTAVGAITADPAEPPTAARLDRIRLRIRTSGVRCVFGEPQTPADVLKSVVAGSKARTGTLDPEGLSLEPGPDLYFTLITDLGDGLVKCLSVRD